MFPGRLDITRNRVQQKAHAPHNLLIQRIYLIVKSNLVEFISIILPSISKSFGIRIKFLTWEVSSIPRWDMCDSYFGILINYLSTDT